MRNKTNLKRNKKLSVAVWAALSMAGGATAHAITIETVPVGNVGNAPDSTGYGAVGYEYNIGKYEVTNAQYAAFLNAVAATDPHGLYSSFMSASNITRTGTNGSYSYAPNGGYENHPVEYVSFWDAARFTNWLNNGQGNVSIETGSYTLGGVTNPVNSSVTRSPDANWVIASENEWYKAAYYDPAKNGATGGYWLHATQSNTLGRNFPFTDSNGAIYDIFSGSHLFGPSGTAPVGTYLNADSFYGTFDQAGNLNEWNDTIKGIEGRGLRGGASYDIELFLRSTSGGGYEAAMTEEYVGDYITFRVVSLASVAIPESSTYGTIFGGVALAFGLLRRRMVLGTC